MSRNKSVALRPPKAVTALPSRGIGRSLPADALERLCKHIAEGGTLKAMAQSLGCSTDTLQLWLNQEPGRRAQYRMAREVAAEQLVDEAHHLADLVLAGVLEPKQVELKIKLNMWTAGKWSRTYSDQAHWEDQKRDLGQLSSEELRERIEQFMASVKQGRLVAVIDQET